MGTRGMVGFVIDGKPLISYNQYDSYPSALGVDTFTWLKETLVETDGQVDINVDLLPLLQRLEKVNEHDRPTSKQIEKIGTKYWENVSTGKDWYAYLRKCQGDLTAIIQSGYMGVAEDSWPLDSLFNEYGYLINVDDKTFDVYRGFQKKVPTDGLWAGVENPVEEPVLIEATGKYYERETWQPVQRVLAIPFAEVWVMSAQVFQITAELAVWDEPQDAEGIEERKALEAKLAELTSRV